MIKIKNIQVQKDFKIKFWFNDKTEKLIDFKSFIKEDNLTKNLANESFFNQVQIYENGRGIYWPNEYDFCPDFLKNYVQDEKAVVH